MKKLKCLLALLLAAAIAASMFPLSAFALEWDGQSADTGSGGHPADVNGYALRFYPGDNCVGYRFSCVDKDGNMKSPMVIDVFRSTYYATQCYTYEFKFTTKMNKLQLIAKQYGTFSTARTSDNCYLESELGFSDSLGTPDTMEKWQNNIRNLNPILKKLGIFSVNNLNSGDKILVEPLYDIKLQTVYHSLTTTEAAVYGAALLGMDSDGGASATAASWGFISVGPNKVYPNHLFTPDGQGLWPGATLLTKKATFRTIINKGYGVGIAYSSEKPDITPEEYAEELELIPITPNARYREGTTVFSSFWLRNPTEYGFTPDDDISAEFRVRKADGTRIAEVNKASLVVPANDQNLVFIRWDVPRGLNGENVTVDGTLTVNGNEVATVSKQYATSSYPVNATPDTEYERTPPSGFQVLDVMPDSTQYGRWWQYTYSDGQYVKHDYCVYLVSSDTAIAPATGYTHFWSGGQYVMKSGYGISVSGNASVTSVIGFSNAPASMFTEPQYAEATFPEFRYDNGPGESRTLERVDGTWVFRQNGDYGRVHFTPLYYPDSGYVVKVNYSDIWTPGGMITAARNTNVIRISGNAYDDWYIGR